MAEQHQDFNEVIAIASSTTTFSGVYQIDPEMRLIDIESEVQAIAGAAPTIDVTPQFSSDGSTWVDDVALTQQTATGTEKGRVAKAKTYMRFKIVTAGTFTSCTMRMFAQAIPGNDSGVKDGETYVSSVLSFMGAVVADVTAMAAVTIGKATKLFTDVAGRLIVTLGTQLAGENLTTDKLETEQNYTSQWVTADAQVLSAAGYIKDLLVVRTGSAVIAGTITLYDNTAESGTTKAAIRVETTFEETQLIPINSEMGTGAYLGFDGTVSGVAVYITKRA